MWLPPLSIYQNGIRTVLSHHRGGEELGAEEEGKKEDGGGDKKGEERNFTEAERLSAHSSLLHLIRETKLCRPERLLLRLIPPSHLHQAWHLPICIN